MSFPVSMTAQVVVSEPLPASDSLLDAILKRLQANHSRSTDLQGNIITTRGGLSAYWLGRHTGAGSMINSGIVAIAVSERGDLATFALRLPWELWLVSSGVFALILASAFRQLLWFLPLWGVLWLFVFGANYVLAEHTLRRQAESLIRAAAQDAGRSRLTSAST